MALDIRMIPDRLGGSVSAIPSKSAAHRLLICSALADRPTYIRIPAFSEDIEATMRCLSALGARIERGNSGVTVIPISQKAQNDARPILDCGESGSTLRFLLPVACALYEQVSFIGHGSLPMRPISDLLSALEEGGVRFSSRTLPLQTAGRLKSGHFSLPGNISSQYISGMLLALPLLEGNSEIELTTALESKAYVDMTLAALRQFGVEIANPDDGCAFCGKVQLHTPETAEVEGDWSNAAPFLCAGALGADVTVSGLSRDSRQADRTITAYLAQFGAEAAWHDGSLAVSAAPLRGTVLDLSQSPDLLPVLAVAATQASGETHFIHCERLRYKESDRIASTAAMLKSLGARVEQTESGMTVFRSTLTGGQVDGCGDHRIVMAAAIASICCTEPVTIRGCEAVGKSYPDFFKIFQSMGGNANVL